MLMVARPGIEPGTQGFSIQKTAVVVSLCKTWGKPEKYSIYQWFSCLIFISQVTCNILHDHWQPFPGISPRDK